MNLRGVREGDIVRLHDDPSLWLVDVIEGKLLRIRVPRSNTTRKVGARAVADAWRKVGRR